MNIAAILGPQLPGEPVSASGLTPSQEARLRQIIHFVQAIRFGLLPSFVLDDNSELALRVTSRVALNATSAHLRDLVRQRAEQGDPEATRLLDSCPDHRR